MSSMHSSNVTQDSAHRARYMAHVQRRSMPPRISPFLIVVVVLSLGMVFIGLTMTVIAHWPGYSTIGQNPLEIIGPVLLSVGMVIFIIAVSISCYKSSKRKKEWEQQYMSFMTASRSTIGGVSMSPTPSGNAKPQKSILKKTPSSSTYGTGRGSEHEESDSGVANTYPSHSVSNNYSYERDSAVSDNSAAGKYQVCKISAMPDPTKPLKDSTISNRSNVLEQSSTDSEQGVVPDPVRVSSKEKHRKRQGAHSPSYTNEAYAMGETDSDQLPRMQAINNETYDESHQDGVTPQHVTMEERSETSRQPNSDRKRHHRKKRHGSGSSGRRRRKTRDGSANPAYSEDQEAALQPSEMQHSEQNGMSKHYSPTQPSPQIDQHLKINIKAQPGTSVHITQPSPVLSSVFPHGSANPSSVETEI